MLSVFREKRFFAKIVLWTLVVMLAVGMIATTASWYFSPDHQGGDSQTDRSQAGNRPDEELQTLLKHYARMAAEKPGDGNVLTGYARIEAEMGRLYLEQGDETRAAGYFQSAAGHYLQALAVHDDDGLRLELAGVYEISGNLEQAEAQLRVLLDKNPHNLQARSLLGQVLEDRRDWPGAREVWLELEKVNDPQTREYARERLKLLENKMK